MHRASERTSRDGTTDRGRALVDPQGRRLDYLRLAVTDRCNLRCRYCMPADGVPLLAREEILSLEELTRLVEVFVRLGVTKLRVTGGEPLVRKGVVDWMAGLRRVAPAPEVLITTNGTRLLAALPGLERAGVKRINLSLDTLDATRFAHITRREGFEAVRASIDDALGRGMALKINVVVQPGANDDELADFVELTRELPVTVRFIEPMPFSGAGGEPLVPISGDEIRRRLRTRFDLEEEPRPPSSVDRTYLVPGHAGRVGIIEGHSRTFCFDCSRLRVDPRGRLRTCLYGSIQADLGEQLRAGASDDELADTIRRAVARREVDGVQAQKRRDGEVSMVNIGG